MAAPMSPAVQQALMVANQHLQRRDIAAAQAVLLPFAGANAHPEVLGTIGAIQLYQGQFAKAEQVLSVARGGAPRDPMLACNLARALAGQGRSDEAQSIFRQAIRLKPDFIEAWFESGHLAHRTGALDTAEHAFRQVLRIMPANVHAKLALGAVLIDAGRPQDAEPALRLGLDEAAEPGLKAQLLVQLAMALRRQRKDAEALEACERAEAIAPVFPGLALHRAEVLQNLGRHDEALVLLRDALAKAPGDPGMHHDYNGLLYRMGRTDEFLKSYDNVPPSRPLLLGKAFFLDHQAQYEESLAVYRSLLARDRQDRAALIGAAKTLVKLGRHQEAGTLYEGLLGGGGADANLHSLAAEQALLSGDPQRAARLCEQGLVHAPHNMSCLAYLGTAWRMMEDERDETLNGYDTLIRSFDLEPPSGFSRMEDFNAELEVLLNHIHPDTREFPGQSLRGGTQTPDRLFVMDHPLVAGLRARVDETVQRYIDALADDPAHPFLSRRASGFSYTGSWSSRLRDCGFHVNHIHPDGWVSSCYYVAVPGAVDDAAARQGWIKFGEPAVRVVLKQSVRRAIQPRPGILVLFPSYTWHGTVPFKDASPRTTVAFDAVPRR